MCFQDEKLVLIVPSKVPVSLDKDSDAGEVKCVGADANKQGGKWSTASHVQRTSHGWVIWKERVQVKNATVRGGQS